MRAPAAIVVVAVAAGLVASCGGGDEQVKTVVVTKEAPAAPAPGTSGATGPPPEAPAPGATGEGAAPTETAPTEPLPTSSGGSTVVQGSYKVTVAEESDARNYSQGDELTWGAVTRCDPECVVELRRENFNGSFTTLELAALGKAKYGRDGTGTIDCLGEVATKTRTSISVRKQRDEGGVPLATEIQGFVRNRFTCTNGATFNELLRVQGRLQE